MSREAGIDALRGGRSGDRIPVMEHMGGLSRQAIMHFTGLDPVADPSCLAAAWDRLADTFEVDLLWGGPLIEQGRSRQILDWDDGATTKTNQAGDEVVQWGIFHAGKAEDGRHYRHIPKPQSPDEALDFDPAPYFSETEDQLYQRFQREHDRFVERNGERCYTLPQWYTTCFHFPLAIFGFELLCEVGMEEERFAALIERFVAISRRVTGAWSKVHGLKGFICHDDLTMTSGPIFSPDWYRRHIFSHYPAIFAPLKEAGVPIVFTSDGDCSMFVDDIFTAGADGLNFEYLVDMEWIVDRYPDKILIGNINSATIARGTPEQIDTEVRRCIEAGARAPRFVINIGGQLTHDIPVANLAHYLNVRKRYAREYAAAASGVPMLSQRAGPGQSDHNLDVSRDRPGSR